MTALRYTLWTLTALGCFAVALMPPPVQSAVAAQAIPESAPTCPAPLPDITAQIEQQGGALLDLVDMPGANFDQVAFFDMGGTIIMGMVFNGCMLGGPIPLGEMQEGTPA